MRNPEALIGASAKDFITTRDPRAKVLAVLLLILTISLLPQGSWLEYGLIYLGILLVAWIGRVPLNQLWRRSLIAAPFFLAALSIPFVVDGPVSFRLPIVDWTVSQTGIVQGGSLILRSWMAVQCFLLLTMITPIHHVFWALETLGMPSLLISIISFTYRYLFVMSEEASRMMTARRARQTGGRSVRVPLDRRMASIGGMIGSLFLRGLERSERVYAAMIGRGYDGTVKMTRKFTWQPLDSLLLLSTILFCALLLAAGVR